MRAWETDKYRVLAVDPGSESSGVVLYGAGSHQLFYSGDMENEKLLNYLRGGGSIPLPYGDRTNVFVMPHHFAIEDIVGMGMAVGKTTFNTCKWIGRFVEAFENSAGMKAHLISRRDVKTVLAGGTTYACPITGARKTVSDAALKLFIKDLFPSSGGGKNPVVGTKKEPGPLYGLAHHSWSALAVALTFKEIKN